MLTYIVRRILIGIFTLLAVTFIVYGLIRNMPGTPLTIMQETVRMDAMMSQSQMDKLEKQYRLDKDWYVGYWYWLGDVLQGELGRGINDRRKVTIIISERLPKTLMLTGTSLLLTYLLCIPLGLWSTASALTFRERLVSTILYILYALPNFVAAVYLNLIIAVRLEWLPLYGSTGEGYAEMSTLGKFADVVSHAILPVLCLTYTSLAYYTRFIKANMMETIQQDYIRTAKAKGASPTSILVTHAFRNSLIPLVTIIGLTLPALLAGSVILETIYQWNGIGYLFYQSITMREYPVIMGLVLMFSVMTLLGQLLADVLYAFVDPRITYS
ncbi:ABC transporter permease [Bremerella alba]|uniref:Glutathione transport system permease protein GsiC n=1 Tax=Bremerella alba TaxID=980252 RepID=A0A7V9A6U1_9BACT|nr:ABC transporter permease [Bremerella alba]MBA2114632.1 Glutathione transport system permease protein GsiC [Bremerella alba]